MPKRGKLSAKEFVERCTNLTIRHLSKLPAEERKKRIEALQKAASRVIGADRRTPSADCESVPIRLAARERE